jgi:hypothetical protein
LADNNDASAEFLIHREDMAATGGADEMLRWLDRRPGTPAVSRPYKPVPEPEGRHIDPFPAKELPADPSVLGTIARGAGEIPKQAFGGIESAVYNATSFMNPLTDWLNNNVADLRYDPVGKPKTAAGSVTRSVSEFLTGFIPALKGMRAAGMVGKVVAPLTASVISDFVVRDPHEARLSNLWNELGLPKNVLTDYLAADPKDSAIEGRFKSAVESAGLGAAAEGVFLGARALKAARAVRNLDASETEFLKGRYGELDDKTMASVLGDPSKPMISTAKTVGDGPDFVVAARDRDTGEVLYGKSGQLHFRLALEVGGGKRLEMGFAKPGGPFLTREEAASAVSGRGAIAGELDAASYARASTSPDDLLARGLIDAGESQVYVNFARIDGPDEVKAMIGSMANRFKGSIDEATRGTVSQAETARLADDLGMTVPDILARRQGQAFNAEEALAARRLLTASGDTLLSAAKAAAAPNAGPLDHFAFRRSLAVHAAIQAEVIGARTETARALASWRIPAGGGVEKARAIEQAMAAMGGPEASTEMARRLAMLAENGASPAALAKFAEKGWGAKTFDAVREVWVNGLLSSPATHIVNSTSNLFVAMQQVYERGAAAQISTLTGSGGVAPGEALAMAHGMVSSVKDAFRMGWAALKTGETGASLNKIDLPIARAVSADALQISSETGLGRAVDFIGNIVTLPGRALGAEDEFFKTIGYRMELHAQAARKVAQEGLTGDAAGKHYAQILLDPPENIRIAAADAALYSTFTNQPGAVGQAFLNLRERVPVISFVLPFIRTPVNIARYAFERTPLAPLVGQWRDDIAAGGARADLALARMSTGTGIMMMALDWADSGVISGQGPGPKDKGEREAMMRQGWQPYSVKAGDRWYSYNRSDPFGMTMGLAADVAEAIHKGEMSNDDVDEWQEVLAMSIAAVSQVAVNKTYLRGVSEFTSMMADPTRYSGQYVTNLIASFTPAAALSGAVERAVDPTFRESNTPADAIRARIAFLSSTLPPRRNLWGEEVKAESGIGKAYDFLSPVASREVKGSPVDTEIMRLAESPGRGDASPPTRIGKRTHFDGVKVNLKDWPKVYDEYTRLAGNGIEHPAWGMGAKDYLNAVVSGKHPMSEVYKLRSDEMKLTFIGNTVSQYRQLAQRAILSDPRFSEFSDYVKTLKADQLQRRMPVLP